MDDSIIKKAEEYAVEHFKSFGIDISTREKRIALDEKTKREILVYLYKTATSLIFLRGF